MKLITKAIADQLHKNGCASVAARDVGEAEPDHKPPLKLFCPWGAATWLITESDPEDPDMLFGLCDLGMGEPELGWVHLPELMGVSGPFGLKIERDLHFTADKAISEYAKEARENRRIVA